MPTLNLLYERSYPINDKVSIMIPTVADVLADEDNYYGLVHTLTATVGIIMLTLSLIGYDRSYNKLSVGITLFYWLESAFL